MRELVARCLCYFAAIAMFAVAYRNLPILVSGSGATFVGLTSLLLVVCAVGLIFYRSWAFYVFYVVAASSLLLFLLSLFFNGPPRGLSGENSFYGIPYWLFIIGKNVLFILLFVILHRELKNSKILDEPVGERKQLFLLWLVFGGSALAFCLPLYPIIRSVGYLNDPPRAGPGEMGGGLGAVFVLLLGVPLCIAGFIGCITSLLFLRWKKVRKLE